MQNEYKMSKKSRIFKIYIPLTVWWIAMLIATTIPTKNLPKRDFLLNDKIIHFIMYFGLTFFFYRFLRSFRLSIPKSIPFTFLILALYAIFDEWHQQFFNRTASTEDYIADVIGIALAGTIIILIKFIKKVRQK